MSTRTPAPLEDEAIAFVASPTLDRYLDAAPDPAAAAIAAAAAAAEYLEHKIAVAAMTNEVISALDAQRKYLGISKAELARRMNRNRSVISRLLNPNKTVHPTIGMLTDCAYALDLELDIQLRDRRERVPVDWPERIMVTWGRDA